MSFESEPGGWIFGLDQECWRATWASEVKTSISEKSWAHFSKRGMYFSTGTNEKDKASKTNQNLLNSSIRLETSSFCF